MTRGVEMSLDERAAVLALWRMSRNRDLIKRLHAQGCGMSCQEVADEVNRQFRANRHPFCFSAFLSRVGRNEQGHRGDRKTAIRRFGDFGDSGDPAIPAIRRPDRARDATHYHGHCKAIQKMPEIHDL